MAWEKVSPALIVKAWEVCGYKTQNELKSDADNMGAVTVWSRKRLGVTMDRAAGNDALTHFLHDVENMPEPMFSEDEEEEEEWDGRVLQGGMVVWWFKR